MSISDNGERKVIKDSSADVKRYYAGHALWGIPIGDEWGTVAWC